MRSTFERPQISSPRTLCRVLLVLGASAFFACSQSPTAETPPAGGPPPGSSAAGIQDRPGDGSSGSADADVVSGEGGSETAEAREESSEVERDWLVDEEGREYYLRAFPKEIGYKRISEDRVHLAWGVEVTVADEDEENFYVKAYRTPERTEVPEEEEYSVEELAEIERSYEYDLVEVDRIQLVPFDRGLPRRGQWRNGFDLADFDGDENLELVHGPPRKGSRFPVVFDLVEEAGWEGSPIELSVGGLTYGDVEAADFDGDGLVDLAVASHLQGIRAFRRTESGGFALWSDGIPIESPERGIHFTSRRLESVDWNGDGVVDLVALDEGPHQLQAKVRAGSRSSWVSFGPALFLNGGDGTWRPVTAGPPNRGRPFGDDLALGDFDGDGSPDFAIGSGLVDVTELVHLNRDPDGWETVALPGIRHHGYVRAVAVADFDRDGLDDLAVAYMSREEKWRTGVDLFLAVQEGEWPRRTVFSREDPTAFTALDAGDVDGDGLLDLVVLDRDGRGKIFLGRGDGSFDLERSPNLDQPRGRCRAYQVAIAEIDGESGSEIVASYADEPNALIDPGRCPSRGGLMAWKVQKH